MRPFLALLRKQIHEARWTLGLSAAVLFGLGWLFVWVTSLNEAEIVRRLGDDSEQGRIQMHADDGGDRRALVPLSDHGIVEPSVHLPADLDLGDRPGLSRGRRRGRARDDGPAAFPARSPAGPISPRA